jgi:hypothetical protein
MSVDEEAAGWKEVAIAWAVCASLHRKFGKGRDAVFKTRQADYVKHEQEARAKYLELTGGERDEKG